MANEEKKLGIDRQATGLVASATVRIYFLGTLPARQGWTGMCFPGRAGSFAQHLYVSCRLSYIMLAEVHPCLLNGK